jgi:hypothetical protein
VITEDDVNRIAQAAADKLMPSITTQNDQFHGATRINIIDSLSKKADSVAHADRLFLQNTVNPRFDQVVEALVVAVGKVAPDVDLEEIKQAVREALAAGITVKVEVNQEQ